MVIFTTDNLVFHATLINITYIVGDFDETKSAEQYHTIANCYKGGQVTR